MKKKSGTEKMVVEECPVCGYENYFKWDTKELGYHAFCNHCGQSLMLCDECCRDPETGKFINNCANGENGSPCKHKVDTSDRISDRRALGIIKRKKAILELEGVTLREWEDIKHHINNRFETLCFKATKDLELIIDREYMGSASTSWRIEIPKEDSADEKQETQT